MRRGSRTRDEHVEVINGLKFIRLSSDRILWFSDAMTALDRAHTALGTAVSRCFKLVGSDYDLERLEWKIDNLERHIGAVRKEIERRRSVKAQEERIALLRNTTGRTPEEAAEFRRKADALERKLNGATD